MLSHPCLFPEVQNFRWANLPQNYHHTLKNRKMHVPCFLHSHACCSPPTDHVIMICAIHSQVLNLDNPENVHIRIFLSCVKIANLPDLGQALLVVVWPFPLSGNHFFILISPSRISYGQAAIKSPHNLTSHICISSTFRTFTMTLNLGYHCRQCQHWPACDEHQNIQCSSQQQHRHNHEVKHNSCWQVPWCFKHPSYIFALYDGATQANLRKC